MVNFLQVAPAFMAGVAFYVAAYHILLYSRLGKLQKYNLSFAALCIAIGIFDILCTGLYNVNNLADGINWLRAFFLVEQFFVLTFPWYILDYISFKKRLIFYPLILFYPIIGIFAFFDQAGLILNTSVPAIKIIQLPFNLEIIYYEVASGRLKIAMGISYLLFLGVLFGMVLNYSRKGHQKEARPLLICILTFFGATANDVAIVSGLYEGFYLVEYSFIGIVIFMTIRVSNSVVNSVVVQRALKENQEQYRTLVEKMTAGLVIVDNQATVTYINDRFS